MGSEFSAQLSSSHHKLIVFDKAIRTRVGGGQAFLLTEHEQFSSLYSAFLLLDRVQGGLSGQFGAGED
jgi:hypothetical protein